MPKANWICIGDTGSGPPAPAPSRWPQRPDTRQWSNRRLREAPATSTQWEWGEYGEQPPKRACPWPSAKQACPWPSAKQACPRPSANPSPLNPEATTRLLYLRGLPDGTTDEHIRAHYPQEGVTINWGTSRRNATLTFPDDTGVLLALVSNPPVIGGLTIRALPYIPESVIKRLKKTLSGASEAIRTRTADAKLPRVQWDVDRLRQRPIRRNLSSLLSADDRPTPEAVAKFRTQHRIALYGPTIPDPCLSLQAAGFPAPLLERLAAQGITSPLPIQAQCWPVMMGGHNCVAIAQTGSGKTLAYLLPAYLHILHQTCPRPGPSEGPTAVVVAPTKELVMQIATVAIGLMPDIRVRAVSGGADNVAHAGPLVTVGVDLLVAAPRRLIMFVQSEILTLNCVTFMVMDEAESTLFMGVGRQVRDLIGQLRPDRQLSCFCATWSLPIQAKAEALMGHDLIRIVLDDMAFGERRQQTASVNREIQQNFIFLESGTVTERIRHVAQLLRDLRVGGTASTQSIVFVNSRAIIDEVAAGLRQKLKAQHPVSVIHGGTSAAERAEAFTGFQAHPHGILVATDVASRGLDIKGLPYVISMYLPSSYDVYVHRIGRTGRAGAKGVAWALFNHNLDRKLAPKLKEGMVRAGQEPPTELENYS